MERCAYTAEMLAVSEAKAREWTKDARRYEKEQQQAAVWRTEIDDQHLTAALALWSYVEATAEWMFGAEVDTGEMDALVTYIASAGKHGRTACRRHQIRVSDRQRSRSRAAGAVCWSGWYQRGPGEALTHTTPRFQRGTRDVHVPVLAVDDRASRQDFRAEPSGDFQCHRRGTTHRFVDCVAVDRGHGRGAVGADVDGVSTGGRTQQSQPAAPGSTSAPPASGTSLTAS